MKYLMILLALPLSMNENVQFDFGKGEELCRNWAVVNDGVMGGLSKRKLSYDENYLVFEGQLSLENNGGFASIRSPWSEYDLSGYKKLKIRVRGMGGEFGITLENSRLYYQPNWRFLFTPSEEWQVLEIPLREFEMTRLGRPMGENLKPKEADDIIRIGIIKADKKTEAFKLEIDYLAFE